MSQWRGTDSLGLGVLRPCREVWAYHPSRTAATPPASEWNVPHDGSIDPTFTVTPDRGDGRGETRKREREDRTSTSEPPAKEAKPELRASAKPKAETRADSKLSRAERRERAARAEGEPQTGPPLAEALLRDGVSLAEVVVQRNENFVNTPLGFFRVAEPILSHRVYACSCTLSVVPHSVSCCFNLADVCCHGS